MGYLHTLCTWKSISITCPGNICQESWLSGKGLVREMSCPGNDLSRKRLSGKVIVRETSVKRCHCHPIISCFIKIHSGLTFLVLAYPSCPGKKGIKWCPSVCLINLKITWMLMLSNNSLIEWAMKYFCEHIKSRYISPVHSSLLVEVHKAHVGRLSSHIKYKKC